MSRQLQYVAWQMQTPEARAEQLKRNADKHRNLIRLINEQFAVVIDGPRAGEIVVTANGKRAGRSRIDTLAAQAVMAPFAARWLSDPDRREMTNEELQRAITNSGNCSKAPPGAAASGE